MGAKISGFTVSNCAPYSCFSLSLFLSLSSPYPFLSLLCSVLSPFLPSFLPSFAAQIFALRSKNYRESLEDDHPSLDGSRPKAAPAAEDGAETVSAELDGLNARFGSAAEGLAGRLRRVGQTIQEKEEEEEEEKGEDRDDGGSRRRPDVKVSAKWLRGASLIRHFNIIGLWIQLD